MERKGARGKRKNWKGRKLKGWVRNGKEEKQRGR